MKMPGRYYTAGTGYRYGFNGKETDNEVKSDGNQQDYGMRIYDPRIAKFLSVDPIYAKYPELTPYQFASNSPIKFIDLDGLERVNPAAKQPTGITALSNAVIPPTGIIDLEHFIKAGNYRLHGVTASDGKQWWIARKPEAGGYSDDFIVGTDAVYLFRKISSKTEWIAYWNHIAEAEGGGLRGGFKAAWSPQNIAAGLTMGLGGVLMTTPKLNVGTLVSPQKQSRHLSGNPKGYLNTMNSIEEAQTVVDALHTGKAKVIDFKDFGKKGGGVTQVDVEFKGVTKQFFTKDLETGLMKSVPTNKFRIEGTGNSVKVFPINPNR